MPRFCQCSMWTDKTANTNEALITRPSFYGFGPNIQEMHSLFKSHLLVCMPFLGFRVKCKKWFHSVELQQLCKVQSYFGESSPLRLTRHPGELYTNYLCIIIQGGGATWPWRTCWPQHYQICTPKNKGRVISENKKAPARNAPHRRPNLGKKPQNKKVSELACLVGKTLIQHVWVFCPT